MPSIPGFWDLGPHLPLDVERAWQQFVTQAGGNLVSNLLAKGVDIENADFIFETEGVVAELKEVQTEFGKSERFPKDFGQLMKRLLEEDPQWRPPLFGGDGKFPDWFHPEFVRLFRPHISRILKKANRQLRDTKNHFGIATHTGVLLLVNDEFISIGPQMVQALAAHLLSTSFSSIDCMVYLTVNRYIEIQGSDTPRLLWAPVYSDRAPDSLVAFIDGLGRRWFDYLESRIGPFPSREEVPVDLSRTSNILKGAKSIIIPKEGGSH